MLCDDCHRNEACIHITQISPEGKMDKNLCEECAARYQNFTLSPDAREFTVNDFLKAETDFRDAKSGTLYNMSHYLWQHKKLWTYWYQGNGDFLDQVIASGDLLGGDGLHFSIDDVSPVMDVFLLNDDGGIHRTYLGPKYVGGFSDHLPVVVRMSF